MLKYLYKPLAQLAPQHVLGSEIQEVILCLHETDMLDQRYFVKPEGNKYTKVKF